MPVNPLGKSLGYLVLSEHAKVCSDPPPLDFYFYVFFYNNKSPLQLKYFT